MKQNKAEYTSKIIKAGALISDTKLLFANWDLDETVDANLERVQSENVFGKSSRKRVENMLRIFRQRYLNEEIKRRSLIKLARGGISDQELRLVLFFFAAQSDKLLYDITIELLYAYQKRGRTAVLIDDFIRLLQDWNDQNKMTNHWGEGTLRRVAQGLSSTLRDFGLLEGVVNKELKIPRLPLRTFSYVAFYLQQDTPSGEKLLHHRDWQLFLISPPVVERLFLEAHQHSYLEYYAAGSTIRISFPVKSLGEYVDVIIQRPS